MAMVRSTSLFGVFLLILLPLEIASQQCSSTSDLGSVECVLLQPHYNEYQWATCLTDDYIMRVSDGRHLCRDRLAGTCCSWYQCMLEVYGLDERDVNDDCRCSTSDANPVLSLPPECYSPKGENCVWYRECLERRYPCEGTEYDYAIEYAEKFCNLYSSNYNDFSPTGRLWVDAVRKCLQVALVPSLTPWVSKTCRDIQDDAFNSHPYCYLSPSPGAPSICELPCLDLLKSFWVVRGALTSAPLQTGKQMLDVIAGCWVRDNNDQLFSGCLSTLQTALRLTLPFIPSDQRLEATGWVVDYVYS